MYKKRGKLKKKKEPHIVFDDTMFPSYRIYNFALCFSSLFQLIFPCLRSYKYFSELYTAVTIPMRGDVGGAGTI
jgi:hypothetical protein